MFSFPVIYSSPWYGLKSRDCSVFFEWVDYQASLVEKDSELVAILSVPIAAAIAVSRHFLTNVWPL